MGLLSGMCLDQIEGLIKKYALEIIYYSVGININ